MKVGDYVRNKYGIAKIIDIEKNNGIDILVFDNDICFLVNKKNGEIKDDKLFNRLAIIDDVDINKINSNPNIIDLIEVGDVLIIKDFVDEVCEIFTDIYLIQNENQLFNIKDDLKKNKNIKIYSIVTKEQFKSMEYKVGD